MGVWLVSHRCSVPDNGESGGRDGQKNSGDSLSRQMELELGCFFVDECNFGLFSS